MRVRSSPRARRRRGAWTRRAARRRARYGGRDGGGREDGRVSDEGAGSRGPRVSPPRFLSREDPGHAHKITKKTRCRVRLWRVRRGGNRRRAPRGDTALLGHGVASLTRRTRREARKPAARTRAVCCASRFAARRGKSSFAPDFSESKRFPANRRAGRVVFDRFARLAAPSRAFSRRARGGSIPLPARDWVHRRAHRTPGSGRSLCALAHRLDSTVSVVPAALAASPTLGDAEEAFAANPAAVHAPGGGCFSRIGRRTPPWRARRRRTRPSSPT